MKRSRIKVYIKAIKNVSKGDKENGLRAIKEVKQGNFIIEGNDILVGLKTFNIPYRYYNLPI